MLDPSLAHPPQQVAPAHLARALAKLLEPAIWDDDPVKAHQAASPVHIDRARGRSVMRAQEILSVIGPMIKVAQSGAQRSSMLQFFYRAKRTTEDDVQMMRRYDENCFLAMATLAIIACCAGAAFLLVTASGWFKLTALLPLLPGFAFVAIFFGALADREERRIS